MTKRFFFTVLSIFMTFSVTAQITDEEEKLRKQMPDSIMGWNKGGVISINISQGSFTNWAAGGINSVSTSGLVSLFANYNRSKSSWANTLDIGYGNTQQGNGSNWIKTDDKIDFSSKYGMEAKPKWYYTAMINFKTQMTPGYNYPNDEVKISDLLAPAYLITSIGMDYKPHDNFSAFISPVSLKNTLVNNQTLANGGAFGVDKASYDSNGKLLEEGKTLRNEFGAYVKMLYRKEEIIRNVDFLTKLDLFTNYLNNPQNIDINWEMLLSMKVNNYITATILANLLYDDDINIVIDDNDDGVVDAFGPRVQFKEVIGVGFTYKFVK